MAEEDLQRFLRKVSDLQAFVAASEADPALRQRLANCRDHQEVVDLAHSRGFAIGRRWGEPDPNADPEADPDANPDPETDPAPETAPDADPDIDADSDADPDADSGSDSDPDADSDSDAGSDADPDADIPDDDNLLTTPTAPVAGAESVTVLQQGPGWRLERIHSCLARSPEGFWYDQLEHEWLCLLQGEALIRFEHTGSLLRLRQGDQLHIKPHQRHRVEATDRGRGTVWLALFWWEVGA